MTATLHKIPQAGNRVRLKTDVPSLGLQCGEAGLVCSTWFAPITVFEVEFQQSGATYPVRALLWEGQIEADERLPMEADSAAPAC